MRPTFFLAALLLLPPQSERQAIAAFSKSMESAPADQRLAYNALQVAFATFREAHESCLSAAPCQLSQNAEQTVLDRSFLSLTVAGRPFPSIPDDSVASADANLNLTYQRLFDSLPDACQPTSATCLSQSAFRDVERDWIRYRDAWVTFGVLHWPESTENYWKSPLTLARIEQLKAMYAARH
jgi:uncharacterized protein YecT (DUF1311 family)